jgi:hypothetical protein
MGRTLMSTILAVWLTFGAGPAAAEAPAAGGILETRRAAWPAWTLPAPLPRPGRGDLEYPEWFGGNWRVSSWEEGSAAGTALRWTVRFHAGPTGGVVGDRAANARAVGRALLGEDLLEVLDDPANPNRQLARLTQERTLESTVVGRRSERPIGDGGVFLADELALQVLHGPSDPRVYRIETLSRYQRHGEDDPLWIEAEQWQARYPSPAEGLAAKGTGTGHWRLRLDPLPPGSDPAS